MTWREELTREHGKNVAETSGEIQRGIESVEHACGIPTLMMGETLEDVARGIDCETVLQPPMACFPFGGSCGSFYGDLKAQGKDAIEFFTDKRVVISRW